MRRTRSDKGTTRTTSLVPISSIAKKLGMTEREVQKEWNSALKKLGIEALPIARQRKALIALAEMCEPVTRCGSVECQKQWIELNGD